MGETLRNILGGMFLFATICLLLPIAAAQVTVSQLGYHPDQEKRVIIYTPETNGTFEVHNGQEIVFTANLTQGMCQGGQTCLVGNFSEVTQQGTYSIHAFENSSPQFTISTSVYADALPLYADLFNALRMQNSSFHPDHHATTCC